MMLTLSKPAKWDFDVKPHDYPPPFTTSTTTRQSPQLNGGPSPPQSAGPNYAMSTSHRGLPPPSAMTLPDPGRGPPMQSSLGSSTLGALPPAPTQWQGSEDGMKNWLAAKAEEEKRKQEEEKTRQENLKLEQRKIEHSMLRESMQGGIPPHLVPIIFAGIGGGNLANISAEWIQQYTAQVQSAHQQAQSQAQAQLSPELRRETRLLGQQPQTVYVGQPPVSQTILPPTAVLPGQPLPASSQQYANERPPPGLSHVGPPTSAPRPVHQSQLPKLTTNEMHIQQPPSAQPGVQQLQSTQTAQEQSSPSIYFHHWVPPASQQEKNTSGHPPATPSGKYKSSPSTSYQSRQRATSHASDHEYISSPKKRKAQGPHAAPPPPTSAPQSYTSPSFSHVSTSSASTPGRRGHVRARSDASARGTEGHMSRRGTVSGLANETRQSDVQDPPGLSEGRHAYNPEVTPPQRSESRGYVQQSAAPTAGPGQPETPKYGSHQQWNRGYHPSPKREADH